MSQVECCPWQSVGVLHTAESCLTIRLLAKFCPVKPTLDTAFAQVQPLVEDFRDNQSHYLSPAYQESEVRTDFINKFLIALGWDVNHDWQKNPFQQEVKGERNVSMSGSQRRADYAFYIAPNFRDVRFFAEAKKPFGDIATADNCFQTIRYGWNAQTPVAILTDFEQFQILDCRYKPDIATARSQILRKYHYTDYAKPEKFAEIYHLFSRDAVADGSLTKFAATLPRKRGKAVQRGLFKGGYQSIDEAFLEELDEYRDTLARAFKNNNPDLDGETLTEITQRTIDRLVFIRFLEDKMIHPEHLVANFGDKGTAWQDFVAASRKLDGIYNGIVFKPHAIIDRPGFQVDDNAFADICKRLSHVNTAYDFNAIPIHSLGSIYERFLGKVIVTTDKRARVEEKPEVRKAGGVYYTPEYIVHYIVENTVGKLIYGKTPAEIAAMRFADIACGSGSFLLGVFDLLLRYHRDWFNANPDKAKKAGCVLREDGAWHLSLKQRREILLNNVYGVDIDRQAVEVAQLSLYLKLLEEETTGTAREYQLEFHETLLPPLNKNIVCGNSLIGTDIADGQLFTSEEERKLNPMDYEQRFPHIFRRKPFYSELKETAAAPLSDYTIPGVPLHGSYSSKRGRKAKAVVPAPLLESKLEGGFDAIVGNPPYLGGREWKEEGGRRYDYFVEKYAVAEYQFDIYSLFLEQGIRLLKQGGRLGFITPNTWLNNQGSTKLRQFILRNSSIVSITDYSRTKVFVDAVVLPILTILQRDDRPSGNVDIYLPDTGQVILSHQISQSVWAEDEQRIFNIGLRHWDVAIRRKIENGSVPLELLAEVKFGIKLYETGKGTPAQKPSDAENHVFEATKKLSSGYRRYLEGKDVNRYAVTWKDRWLKYGGNLAAPRDPKLFQGQRLLVRRIVGERLIATFTDDDYVTSQLLQIVKPLEQNQAKYFLAVLNSSLQAYYFKKKYNRQDKTFPEIRIYELAALPIRQTSLSNTADKSRHDRMVALVEQMLVAQKQLAAAQSDADKDFYGNKCAGLDHQIDTLVYELYALTPEEITIVEGVAP